MVVLRFVCAAAAVYGACVVYYYGAALHSWIMMRGIGAMGFAAPARIACAAVIVVCAVACMRGAAGARWGIVAAGIALVMIQVIPLIRQAYFTAIVHGASQFWAQVSYSVTFAGQWLLPLFLAVLFSRPAAGALLQLIRSVKTK